MEYRSLGRTGVKVSVLCLGCWNFGKVTESGLVTDEPEACRMIDHAIDAGINFLDTSNIYGRGRSETITGNALRANGKRARIVLATKVHFPMNDDDPNACGNHRRHIIEQCEASLKRLQTDYIDLYQLHRPQPDVPIDESLRAMDDLIRSGKVRYIGTSTFAAWQIMESLWASKELCLNRFVSEQPPYNLLERRIEREMIPMARTYGIAILPWTPLADGLLSGKHKRGKPPVKGTRVSEMPDRFDDSAYDVAERVGQIAAEKGCTSSQLSVAWCAQQPGVTSPIVGPRSLAQLEDVLPAAVLKVTDDDRKRLDEVSPPGGSIVQYYEADFGPHPHRWF